jgi:hypothetical protein
MVVAEKLETLVSKGLLNSRMKDFYDLRTLVKEFQFNGSALTKAIMATFARRGTQIPRSNPAAFTEEFYTNADKQIQWKAFLKTSKLEDITLELSQVTNEIQTFLSPPMIAAVNNKSFDKKWASGGPWE